MIGGLPNKTAENIGRSIMFAAYMVMVSVLTLSLLAGILAVVAVRTRGCQ